MSIRKIEKVLSKLITIKTITLIRHHHFLSLVYLVFLRNSYFGKIKYFLEFTNYRDCTRDWKVRREVYEYTCICNKKFVTSSVYTTRVPR